MTKLIVIIGFIVAFSAGWVVGIEMRTSTIGSVTPTTHPSHGQGGWLTAELNLSPSQTEALNKIWSETARTSRGELDDRRRQYRQDREAAIAALIAPADKDKLDAIQQKYSDQMAALDKEMKDSFAKAVEQTKAILTPQQRSKYEALLAKRQADREQRDQHSGDQHWDYNRRGDERATTQPRSGS